MHSNNTFAQPSLAYDDVGGNGHPILLLPGAGDLRSEYRFVVESLRAAGHRIVVADLPGHGESPFAPEYTVESTAQAIVDLLEHLDAGPATLVGCSFAPAAAVWAATERPDLVAGIVAISPHFTADKSMKGRMLSLAVNAIVRGPWAGALWAKLYAGWYKTNPPQDLGSEIGRMRVLLSDPQRRRAVRETLTAEREGVGERMAGLGVPTLTIFGSLDDHFADPSDEARSVAAALGGLEVVIDGAGHYPHVEDPDGVTAALLPFLAGLV
jgi:pimeloyl-ACP methyl ester carboxylesterase